MDRSGSTFGFIILRLENPRGARRQTIRLARLLHSRLRDTDECGHLGPGRIGVLLPETDSNNTQLVLESLLELAAERNLSIDGEAFAYPDETLRPRWGSPIVGQRDMSDVAGEQADYAEANDAAAAMEADDDEALAFQSSETGHAGELLAVAVRSTKRGKFATDRVGHAVKYSVANESIVRVDLPHRWPNDLRASKNQEMHRQLEGVEPRTSGVLAGLPLDFCLPAYPRWKRGLDILGSSVGLLLSGPVLLTLAATIKLTSRGPVLFCQERTGYQGKPFTIYKLRSMVLNAEELQAGLLERNERDGPAFKLKYDPRVTRVGRLLRATGLDELPQLLNVLRGDMSLVGPRPLPVHEAAECNPWQARRHDVKPGLTCFWQLSKSRKMTFGEWMRLDLQYARSASPLLDLWLVVRTFVCVFLGRVGH